MRKTNVLLTAAGTMKGPTVISMLRAQKEYNVKIVACDMDPLSAGLFFADSYYLVPQANDPSYISRLLEICKKEKINVLIPLLSKELPVISQNKAIFKENRVEVIVSDWTVIRTTQDKWLTYLFFKKHKIATPKTWLPKLLPKNLKFPLMVKPRISSGTKNITKAENRSQLKLALKTTKDPILQKFIDGQEYTIDLIADQNGHLLGAVPRIRIKVMDGKSVKGKTVRHILMNKLVSKIVKKLSLYGPANIQCIETDKKEIFFTEVNPRLAAGGLPLAVAAGLNIPLICLKLALGDNVKPYKQTKRSLYMVRYLDEIFIKKINGRMKKI